MGKAGRNTIYLIKLTFAKTSLRISGLKKHTNPPILFFYISENDLKSRGEAKALLCFCSAVPKAECISLCACPELCAWPEHLFLPFRSLNHMAIALPENAQKGTWSGGYNETSIANSKLNTVSTTQQAYITQAGLRLSVAKAGLERFTLLLLPPWCRQDRQAPEHLIL